MKYFVSFVVFILAAVFCIISGRLVEEDFERNHEARASTGNKSKGLLWQLFCKNESQVENNMIVCLLCRGLSRLCFNIPMTSGVSGSNPGNAGGKPSSSSGSTSSSPVTTSTIRPSSGEPSTEPGKAI